MVNKGDFLMIINLYFHKHYLAQIWQNVLKIIRTGQYFLHFSFLSSSKKYCYVAEALDYENAEKNCNRINGILFEPKSNEENTNVYQTFSEVLHSQVWIGINDIGGGNLIRFFQYDSILWKINKITVPQIFISS